MHNQHLTFFEHFFIPICLFYIEINILSQLFFPLFYMDLDLKWSLINPIIKQHISSYKILLPIEYK